jgi:hypothetical protein
MSNAITISCILDTSDPTAILGFEAWVDDNKFFDTTHVCAQQQLSVELCDDNSKHELRFVMKNKTWEHTQVDADNNIVSDAKLILKDLEFDGIALGHMLTELAVYTHDFNGTQPETQTKFYSEIGCNGTVSLKFSTPMYIWLLEHM